MVVPEKDYKVFYSDVDKGSPRPAFCSPRQMEEMKESVDKMERALQRGHVHDENKASFELSLKQKKQRLQEIERGKAKAERILEKDKDYWAGRRKALAADIRNALPSRKDVEARRVNPHTVHRMEKGGLGEMKTEYIVISHLLGEDSNTAYLQR